MNKSKIFYQQGFLCRFLFLDQKIAYHIWTSKKSKSKGTLVFVHGHGSHGKNCLNIVNRFVPLGWNVYALDQRGYGLSGGKRGCIRSFSEYWNDLWQLLYFVSVTKKEKNIFLVAHSLGGLIALSYVMRRGALKPMPLSGLILSSPCLGLKVKVNPFLKLISKPLSLIFPDYVHDNGLNPGILTHDEKTRKDAKKDKLSHHKMSVRLFVEMTKMMERIRADSQSGFGTFPKIPYLFLCAGDDLVVSTEETVKVFNRIPHADKKLVIYTGFYHEVFNEIGRGKVFDDMEKWLESKIKK